MEGFEELAQGAGELSISVRHGNLTLTAAVGARWGLEWSSDKGEIPIVQRHENGLQIRQRDMEEPFLQHHLPQLNVKVTIPPGIEVVELHTGHGSIDVRGLAGRSLLRTGNGALSLNSSSGNADLSSGHGPVTVEKFEGDLTLRTENGHVRGDRLRGTATLQTGHGPIEVRDAHGTLLATTGNGDVRLTSAKGTAVLRSGHGRIEVSDMEGTTEARTNNGDILLKGARGGATLDTNHGKVEVSHSFIQALQAHSGTGDIVIQGGSVDTLSLATQAGSVHCSTELAPGKHEISSGNGDLTITATAGEVSMETRHGRIHVTQVQNMLRARTGNGDILVIQAAGELDLDTAHGRVEVTEASGKVVAHSGNGDLLVQAVQGEVALRTGHGRIDIGAGLLQAARLETNAGGVTCRAELAPGEHTMTSGNGDVTLRLPSNAQARVDAQTGHGQIHSDFPMVSVGRSGGAGGGRMVGSIGEGIPDLVIAARTTNGQIRIERGPNRSVLPTSHIPSAIPQLSLEIAAPTMPTEPSAIAEVPDDGQRSPAVGQTVRLNPTSPGRAAESGPDSTLVVLEAVARGELTTDEAAEMLWGRS